MVGNAIKEKRRLYEKSGTQVVAKKGSKRKRDSRIF